MGRAQARIGGISIWLTLIGTPLLLGIASAPFSQWYLAWVSVAPLLIAIGNATAMRGAALRAMLAGLVYFSISIWWLWTASIPGTIVLILCFALCWAAFASIVHRLGILKFDVRTGASVDSTRVQPPAVHRGLLLCRDIITVASVWVAIEWFRCYLLWGFHWVPLGATQTPQVVLCQVADLGGPWVVSFYLMLFNALVAFAWFGRQRLHDLYIPGAMVLLAILAVVAYGTYRLRTTTVTSGPRVMVLQSNFRHRPGGALDVDRGEVVSYYLTELDAALAREPANLAILPESALPPINEESRRELTNSSVGPFLEQTHQRLLQIAERHRTAILVGGTAVTGWTSNDRERVGSEIRNSAYFVDPTADVAVSRYDKIYLVPFSERVPLMNGPLWMRNIVAVLAASRAVQPMHPGDASSFKPFELTWTKHDANSHRDEIGIGDSPITETVETTPFVAPICLENVDPEVVARMMRGRAGIEKNASFIANLSNDGWFAALERYQHLQTTVFRCIENRVPMARSSNTGISGFIDSIGGVHQVIPVNATGVAVRQIDLDPRVSPYMRFGNVFIVLCMSWTFVMLALELLKGVRNSINAPRVDAVDR